MKRKDIEELKNKSAGELEKLLKDTQERLRVLKFDQAAGKIKNFNEMRESRKTIARIFTFLKQSATNQPTTK